MDCPICGRRDMQGVVWIRWFGKVHGIIVCRRCHISTYPGSLGIQSLRWTAAKHDHSLVERYSNNAWRKLMRREIPEKELEDEIGMIGGSEHGQIA